MFVINFLKFVAYLFRKLLFGEIKRTTFFGASSVSFSDTWFALKMLLHKKQWKKGEEIGRFEKQIANYLGVRYVVTFLGGRVALSAILRALELREKDEVIVAGYTCVVVPNAITYLGSIPVFVDIESETFGLDANKVEVALTSKTRAIVIQHLYGLMSRDCEKIIQLARDRGIYVIEDTAQSLGSTFKGKMLGTYGDVGFFSLDVTKPFTTGLGGFAVTNNDQIGRKLLEIQEQMSFPSESEIMKILIYFIMTYLGCHPYLHWIFQGVYAYLLKKYWIDSISHEEKEVAFSSSAYLRFPNILASLGQRQLRRLNEINQERRKIAATWEKISSRHGWKTPTVCPESVPIFLRYPVLVNRSDELVRTLQHEYQIEVGRWFTTHLYPSSRIVTGCPVAAEVIRQILNFPCTKYSFNFN